LAARGGAWGCLERSGGGRIQYNFHWFPTAPLPRLR
jgi:hypothetical protein